MIYEANRQCWKYCIMQTILIHINGKRKRGRGKDMSKRPPEVEHPVTPQFLVKNLLSAIDEQEIESVAYVARTKDGLVTSGWTDMMYTEAIGLYEIGKLQAVKEMK